MAAVSPAQIVVTPAPTKDSVTSNNDECAICCVCFEPLHEHSLGVLYTDTNKRSCSHVQHYKCIRDWEVTNHKSCPECRSPFHHVGLVPSLSSDPKGWFAAFDVSGEGKLHKKEIITIMRSQFPVSFQRAEEIVDGFELWQNVSGMDYDTMVDPHTGLVKYFKDQFPIQADREPSARQLIQVLPVNPPDTRRPAPLPRIANSRLFLACTLFVAVLASVSFYLSFLTSENGFQVIENYSCYIDYTVPGVKHTGAFVGSLSYVIGSNAPVYCTTQANAIQWRITEVQDSLGGYLISDASSTRLWVPMYFPFSNTTGNSSSIIPTMAPPATNSSMTNGTTPTTPTTPVTTSRSTSPSATLFNGTIQTAIVDYNKYKLNPASRWDGRFNSGSNIFELFVDEFSPVLSSTGGPAVINPDGCILTLYETGIFCVPRLDKCYNWQVG